MAAADPRETTRRRKPPGGRSPSAGQDPLFAAAPAEGPPLCRRCGQAHDRVDVVTWLWRLRDTKPKPPGKQGLVLAMLAARMDPRTGCGRTTDTDLADLAGLADVKMVREAVSWAADRLLLHRVNRGYRITDERSEQSLWVLTDPHNPTGDIDPVGPATQQGTSPPLAPEPTGDMRPVGSGANRGYRPEPTGRISPTKARPVKARPVNTPARYAHGAASDAVVTTTAEDGGPGTALTQFALDGTAPGPTEGQRAKVITDAYAATKPRGMIKYQAVRGVVARAIKAGEFTDEQIQAALLRLSGGRRPVTLDTLGEELTRPGQNGHHRFDASAAWLSAAAEGPPIIQIQREPD